MKVCGLFAKCIAVSLIFIGMTVAGAGATTTAFNTFSGWYSNTGTNQLNSGGLNETYSVGSFYGYSLNNYFVFDLSGLSKGTAVSSATFNVAAYAIAGTPSTYTIYETSLTPADVEVNHDPSKGGTAEVTLYTSLASGTAIGSIAVTSANNSTNLSISLNNAGLSWIQANEGNQIVLGGSNNQPIYSMSYIFGGSVFTPTNNLTISSVPLPAGLLLFGPGLVGLAAVRRRFKN